jgi:hypothetical protein
MKKPTPIKSPTPKVDPRPLPPTQVKVVDRGKGLQLYIPSDLYKALKEAAFERDTTIRAIVLASLKKDGFPVSEKDLRDRRTAIEV